MKIGTVLAFADNSPVSETIEFFTNSDVSHVAVVVELINDDAMIVEAATFESGNHVGAILFSERVREFTKNNGNIWELNLSKENQKIIDNNLESFRLYLYSHLNKDYDMAGAIGAGLDFIENQEDDSTLFCSELIALAFKKFKILPISLKASEVTPIELCQFAIYSDIKQLIGENQEIKGFNSISI